MAHLLLKMLNRSRALLVAGLAMTILSAPLASQARSTSSIQANVTDTIAGLSTEIEFRNAESFSPIEVLVSTPNGKQLALETITDQNGVADLTISDYHLRDAGIYHVEARHSMKKEGFGRESRFEVHTGTLSVEESTAKFSKNTAKAKETVELKVTLNDEYGNPIEGHTVQALSSRSKDQIYSPDFATNENGEMKFYVKSSYKGISEFSIMDSSINKALQARPKMAFLTGKTEFKEVGGWDNNFTNILLAAEEAGEVDGFRIDGFEFEVPASESQSVSIVAIDEDGLTVSDYTGTVHFSSSDDSATLPNDYTFTAEDQGEHEFSLAVKFVAPGTHLFTVTDVDQINIIGEEEVEVVSGLEIGEEEVDFGEDFETEDFEREGDFDLISPVSGTYSSDDIEVQGEADYGFSAIAYLNEEEYERAEVDFDNSFSLQLKDIKDGTYNLYVDIVELGDGDPGEEEILEIIESSSIEEITVDTTAPELISIEVDPQENLEQGEEALLTILSEANLEEVSVILNEEIYNLSETNTSGKYEGEIIAPEADGSYTIDVVLVDTLGNEVQYRDQLTIIVGELESETAEAGEGAAGKVTGVTAIPGEGQVTLTWESAPQGENAIAFYKINYGPSPSALFATSETFDGSTTWFIPGLESTQVYYFSVLAVDVEGQEGEASDPISSSPIARTVIEPIEFIPPTTLAPVITETGTPGEIPDSGPATNALILLSILGALTYTGARKLAFARD